MGILPIMKIWFNSFQSNPAPTPRDPDINIKVIYILIRLRNRHKSPIFSRLKIRFWSIKTLARWRIEESISYFVSTEQLQWIEFAHFTLNETGKTLKGLNGWRSGGQGWGWGILLTLTSPSQIPGHESVSSVTQLRAITSILSPRVFMTLLSRISSL